MRWEGGREKGVRSLKTPHQATGIGGRSQIYPAVNLYLSLSACLAQLRVIIPIYLFSHIQPLQ